MLVQQVGNGQMNPGCGPLKGNHQLDVFFLFFPRGHSNSFQQHLSQNNRTCMHVSRASVRASVRAAWLSWSTSPRSCPPESGCRCLPRWPQCRKPNRLLSVSGVREREREIYIYIYTRIYTCVYIKYTYTHTYQLPLAWWFGALWFGG